MRSQTNDNPQRKPLPYENSATPPTERAEWVSLIVTLAFCLAAAIVYFARFG